MYKSHTLLLESYGLSASKFQNLLSLRGTLHTKIQSKAASKKSIIVQFLRHRVTFELQLSGRGPKFRARFKHLSAPRPPPK